MLCPFRKEIRTMKNYDGDTYSLEEFGECYKDKCALYSNDPEIAWCGITQDGYFSAWDLKKENKINGRL